VETKAQPLKRRSSAFFKVQDLKVDESESSISLDQEQSFDLKILEKEFGTTHMDSRARHSSSISAKANT